jgi:hypothetical protein
MKTSPLFQRKTWLLAVCGSVLATIPMAHAKEGITAVYSKVSDDYVRDRLADGTFENETYAFGNGGYFSGPFRDATIDFLSFNSIVRTLSVPLAAQNYMPARDPNKTKLLIMVYWGMTRGSQDPELIHFDGSNGRRNPGLVYMTSMQEGMSNEFNASILGYDAELSEYGLKANRQHEDLIGELEKNRYFVVLMAYDFQMMWKQKKHKLVWESRFSVREQGNDFTVALPAMAQYASEYFGQNSNGLIRTRVPDGRIDMGDPTVIEYLSGYKGRD